MTGKTIHSVLIVGLFSSLPAACAFGAGDAPRASSETIHYMAPSSPAGVRLNGIGHGRGAKIELPNLFILTPDHVGLTVQEQPTIFWYLSDSAAMKLTLTITKDGEVDPLLETQVPAKKGIGHFSLADKNVKLEPDVQYQVTLALIPDKKDRSNDLCASGMIKRVKPPEALLAKLVALADPMDRAMAYAKQGIWYDALTVLSEEIDDKETDSSKAMSMRRQRAALMEQVSLNDVANFDLGADVKQQ